MVANLGEEAAHLGGADVRCRSPRRGCQWRLRRVISSEDSLRRSMNCCEAGGGDLLLGLGEDDGVELTGDDLAETIERACLLPSRAC